jgi:hypothetical protein
VTERRGSPYTVECTKTTATHERLLKSYSVDLDHFAEIQAIVDWHNGL